MFEKERTEKDVLNRFRWDDDLSNAASEYTLTYKDRFKNELMEIELQSIDYYGCDYFLIIKKDKDGNDDISEIPIHRIRQFKHNGKIVWDKRRNKQ